MSPPRITSPVLWVFRPACLLFTPGGDKFQTFNSDQDSSSYPVTSKPLFCWYSFELNSHAFKPAICWRNQLRFLSLIFGVVFSNRGPRSLLTTLILFSCFWTPLRAEYQPNTRQTTINLSGTRVYLARWSFDFSTRTLSVFNTQIPKKLQYFWLDPS